MEEKNELNDIILNKGNASSGNKKIILAVATLGVILIIVVMLMNTLTSNNDNLPKQPAPIPQPQEIDSQSNTSEEPLFEEVEVIQEQSAESSNLESIAQKLKEESMQEQTVTPPKVKKIAPKVTKKKVTTHTASGTKLYYVQVGSFSKYKPNKKFLKSITDRGYEYKYNKVGSLTKVLVGPFENESEARGALRTIRSNIEAGAFLTRKAL